MMRTLNAAFATISQRIRALDPDTYTRMRFSHRPIIKAALNDVGQLRHADAHKKWYGKHPERATTSSARIGGLGSMLAVSFEVVPGLTPTAQAVFDRCKEGESPLFMVESGWQGWPEGAKEKDVLSWFAPLVDRLLNLADGHRPRR